MNWKNRWLWVGLLVLLAMILLSILAAPRSSSLQQGSTYSRAPSGYGAWYAYMEQQNLPVQRWQRPLEELLQAQPPSVKQISTWHLSEGKAESGLMAQAPLSPITLVRISSDHRMLGGFDEDWIRQGNQLVLLGVRTGVTKAPFRSAIASPVGAVKVETTRRYNQADNGRERPTIRPQSVQPRLSDAYGAVVWERQIGEGRVLYSSTPYLAANAYQDEPGNFKFLAELVSNPSYPIYIDEYLHGYKDQEVIAEAGTESLASYLAKTPLALLAIQAAVLLLVLIWGHRRLGPAKRLVEPTLDNSEAYVQALSRVLQKANCSDFVVQTIGKAEQFRLQRALGLGSEPVEPQTLVEAWVQQTGQPATELEAVLAPLNQSRRLSNRELLLWLENLQTLHRQLNSIS
ncbi:DUF4350 domain-containing protein [Leptolyngbya sp. NK1-12]|uniref:DUF4350 domain-containing protein n=1 Tax=Leptolyngbya sp. NK1-12 TaxID=2547451 RepID=A0AA96WHC1_9CYAN|nr:DUF4350 domain-containing protein [Leptolyngbya sp. NK1-12]WNZ24635.1 DUF4350 domain-containing protein [Leptolyngbya sp. NK1-12]